MKNPAAVALGRLGGKVTSEAKAQAARENAKLGGWPKGKKRGKRKRVARRSNKAAKELNRQAIGIEINPKYVQLINKLINKRIEQDALALGV